MSETTVSERAGRVPIWPLFGLGLVKLLVHFVWNGGYNIFRDEFYFIACGRHLDWGYVDHPPLVPLLARVSVELFGESMFAIRLFPAIAGALMVVLVGLMARELGGGLFAQLLAALCALITPLHLGSQNMMSIPAFEPLYWGGCSLILIRLLRTGNQKLWVGFGVVAGLGLQNKISILFFGFAVFAGLVLTPQRKMLQGRWPWIGAAVAGVIFLPNLIWQAANGWPTVEFLQNASKFKNLPISPLGFFSGQVLEQHPFVLPIWLTGLGWYLFSRTGRPYRMLGVAFVVLFVLLVALKSKTYYLAPAYGMLVAAGAFAIERFLAARRWPWARPAMVSVLVVSTIVVAPMALPILPPATYLRYERALGLRPPQNERGHTADLPQHFGDMFGWEEMMAVVVEAYGKLSPAEKKTCGIFASNYGEAGAVDFYGKRYGLPPAMSGHNNYYLWGPGDVSGEVMILIGMRREELEEWFEAIDPVGVVECDYCMPYQNGTPVFVCRKPKVSLQEAWPRVKRYM